VTNSEASTIAGDPSATVGHFIAHRIHDVEVAIESKEFNYYYKIFLKLFLCRKIIRHVIRDLICL
jgi:hypothetical protein